jgi:hypothetical protein
MLRVTGKYGFCANAAVFSKLKIKKNSLELNLISLFTLRSQQFKLVPKIKISISCRNLRVISQWKLASIPCSIPYIRGNLKMGN